MFRAHVLIVRRPKLYYTTSGIITPIGGRSVHRLREDWIKLFNIKINTLRCTVSKISKFVQNIFTLCHKWHDFRKKKKKLNLKCVLIFYFHYKFLLKLFPF